LSILRLLAPLALIALLGLLALRTDLAALQAAMSQVSVTHVILGLVLIQVQVVISALRWRFTAKRLTQDIPVSLAISEYYVASFINQSLPGGISGDAIRAYRMRSSGAGGWKAPAKAVIYERLSGQLAFFLLAFSGLGIWPFVVGAEDAGHLSLHLTLVGGLVMIATGIGLAWARQSFPRAAQITNDLASVFVRDKAWMVQSFMSLAIVSAYVGTFYVASDAIGATLPWTAALTIIPLCLIAMLIPAGLGGWGTREAAAIALWPLVGASATEGLAASLIYGGLSLAGALPGLALLSLEAIRRRSQRA
jgi:glycosyltransferase 2 family protein